ncbi:hypothetical protein VTO42DRAFT_6444 [Malbranchea cinnamomea]
MGFLRGFIGGVAFTTSVLFITLQIHLANRQHQHNVIREQIDSINALALRSRSREGYEYDAAVRGALARRGYSPRERPAMMELWKEQWNKDVQAFVRKAQEIEWQDLRAKADEAWETLRRFRKEE